MNDTYTITDVARVADTTPRTIIRWEARGKIPKAARDYRGYRRYTQRDVEVILKFKNSKRVP